MPPKAAAAAAAQPVATPAMVVAATPKPAATPAEREPEVRRAIPVNASAASAAPVAEAPRAVPVAAAAPTTSEAPTPSAAGGGEVRTYKVERGDTLAAISRKFYRSTVQWQKIYEANKATLADPTKLQPGMVLVIP